METSDFWHAPLWKWFLVFLLVDFAALLAFWKARPVPVEMLPLAESRATWDGANPYLVVSWEETDSEHAHFKSAVRMIRPTLRHESPVNEFQVELNSGMFLLRQTNLHVPDTAPFAFERTYRTWDFYTRAFGVGTNHSYDVCLTGSSFPYTYINLSLEDGRRIHFRRVSKGTGYADAVYRHDETSSEFYGAQIAWDGNGWTLALHDGSRVLFPESYLAQNCAQGAPLEIRDSSGNSLLLKRDQQRNLEELVSNGSSQLQLKYDGAGRITRARDSAGNERKYGYDSHGHLERVSSALHLLYRFEYEPLLHSPGYEPYLMTAVIDGNWNVLVENVYNERGMVIEQRLADGSALQYEYVFGKTGRVTETIVTFPGDKKKRLYFEDGRVVRQE